MRVCEDVEEGGGGGVRCCGEGGEMSGGVLGRGWGEEM